MFEARELSLVAALKVILKRDLSDKLNNKEERIKSRESSLDISLSKETSDDADVFTKGIESVQIFSMTV